MRPAIAPHLFSAFAVLALSVASPLVAQTSGGSSPDPETVRYYDSLLSRLAGGEDIQSVIDSMQRDFRDHIPPGPGDFGFCPAIPPGGIPGVTNDRFYFLSEILPAGVGLESAACGFHLGCFLDQVTGHPIHDNATLVIDRQCVSKRTLIIPNRFEIAGVGLNGAGSLVFELPDGARAIRFKNPVDVVDIRNSQIRDLTIGNRECCGQVGIDVSNSTLVQLKNLYISGFAFGVLGEFSYYNTVTGSNLSNNGFGAVLGRDTTTWRFRDTAASFTGLAAIVFHPQTRQSVIDGGVFESNPFTGVLARGIGNTIQNSWFEGNGGALFGTFGIRIPAGTKNTTVLSSTFSTDSILDAGTDTRRCFNFSFALGINSCPGH